MKIGNFADLTLRWGTIQLSKHKFIEYQLEFDKFNDDPFEFSLSWTTRRDHAGFDFIFSIYKLFWYNFCIYDHRHWDYEKDCWKQSDTCDEE